MTLSVQKIGLNTKKISFGKGTFSKGYSYNRERSYSPVNNPSSSEERAIHRNEEKKEPTKLKNILLDKLEEYADDPVMVRIITEQLRKLS